MMDPVATAVQPPPLSASLPEGVCSSFAYRGRCRFANCRFLHVEVDLSLLQQPSHPSSSSSSPPPIGRKVPDKSGKNRSTTSSQQVSTNQCNPAATADRVTEGNRSWRSVDFMLQGQSVKDNAYLREFASAPWLASLLEAPEYSNLLSVRGKSLRKELTEAFGAVAASKRAMEKMRLGEEEDFENVCFVDLCCGKGFSSLLLSLTFPKSKVIAVDSNPDMELSHFRGRDNLEFRSLDVTSKSALPTILASLGEASTHTATNRTLIFLGIHLCGSLSRHALRLYREAPSSAALVLAPCCLDSRVVEVKRLAKRLKVDPHLYWCLTLLMEIPPLENQRKELLVDSEVLSAKNTFIIASRDGPDRRLNAKLER